jgi:hypothetical protein
LTAPIGVPSGSRRNTTIKQPPIGRQTIDYLDQATIDYRDHSHLPNTGTAETASRTMSKLLWAW